MRHCFVYFQFNHIIMNVADCFFIKNFVVLLTEFKLFYIVTFIHILTSVNILKLYIILLLSKFAILIEHN